MNITIRKAEKKPKSSNDSRKKGLISVAVIATVTLIAVFSGLNNRESWLTKSTIQRRVLPSEQCGKTDSWYQDDTGRIIGAGEADYIISGMEYFYEKTGVQPFLWATPFYDGLYDFHSLSERKEHEEKIMADKYEELFKSDGGHVLIALSDSRKFAGTYCWLCYPGENAKMQVMDDEASKILLDCLSFMFEPNNVHPGLTIGNAFVKAANTIMTDQTFKSYAVAIVIVGVLLLITIICISSIRKSGKENVAYHKTLKAREEARKEEAIADQKQAELDRKKYEDELETQYMAIPCPNCGGSGNKIRKGTVGICKYCGTAIKVGRDGKIEFLSNDSPE